jgi:hypothetical protein
MQVHVFFVAAIEIAPVQTLAYARMSSICMHMFVDISWADIHISILQGCEARGGGSCGCRAPPFQLKHTHAYRVFIRVGYAADMTAVA